MSYNLALPLLQARKPIATSSNDFPARPLPDGAGAILADAAWREDTWSAKGQGRSPSRKYDCMSVDEIAALPVASIAARDCRLFLWTPAQHLANAIAVMKAWGFAYSSTAFVWVKTTQDGVGYRAGQGRTTRKGTEICLLGKRGRLQRKTRGVDELIVAPRREHSRKPDEQYARIEQFCAGPYVELFARQRWPGWIVWGHEVGLFSAEKGGANG
jgi:N6-adenosine-specific RNA methylase IME4